MKHLLRFAIGLFLISIGISMTAFSAVGDTVLATSFETSGTPPFSVGSINNQNLWTITSGAADVAADPAYANDGSNGLKFSTASSLLIKHTPFSGTVPGVSGTVYFDMYVKLIASSGKEFTINGYDLFSSSIKRTFVVDFTLPVNDTGSIRIYNGSSKVRISGYSLGSWYRVSGKVDYINAVYQVCVNAGPSSAVAFRETYTPTASGTRLANVKEYHQLLFNLGSNTNTGTVDAAIDQLYIGTIPMPDINFGDIVLTYTVSVQQPVVGSISLNPSGGVYYGGTSVKATLTYPTGYKNYGWTGDVSGTYDTVTFQVTKNMTIGATVSIDSVNPPALCKLTVIQPSIGSISLLPAAVSDSSYYASSKITATLTVPSGYRNNGWTGVLSGTELSKSFTITKDTVLGANVEPLPPGIRKTFSSASAFKAAVKAAAPGDTIELTDGIYDVGGISTDSAAITGTLEMPILIRAQNRGKVELNGNSSFDFRFTAYITVEGFVFTSNPSTAIRTECCNNIRITRNIFRLSETTSSKWILIGGYYRQPLPMSHHNRIDHNLFEEKHQLGNCITIDGSPDGLGSCAVSQYDKIDHNHFRNVGPRAVNEMETIRMGWSAMSTTSAYDTVEYNLFEQCDGDPEIISVKSCDNVIRYNTFRRSQGTVCLRSTDRTTVEGNFFLGEGRDSTGGIRAYGDDHKIFNNYFERLGGDRWDAACTITNGDAEHGGSVTDHWRPRNITVAFNTYVDNYSNFEFGYTSGGSYTKPAQNLMIANNLVVGTVNPFIKIITAPESITYSGNIMNPTGTATVGITAASTEINVLDPLLERRDSILCLSASSPGVNAAIGTYSYITTDIQGQMRTGVFDVGADEYSTSAVLRRPLTPQDVGPDAIDSVITGIRSEISAAQPHKFRLEQNYPNPFNPTTVISYRLSVTSQVALRVYDLLGREVAVLVNEYKPAGLYSVTWDASQYTSGLYFARLESGGNFQVQKLVLIK